MERGLSPISKSARDLQQIGLAVVLIIGDEEGDALLAVLLLSPEGESGVEQIVGSRLGALLDGEVGEDALLILGHLGKLDSVLGGLLALLR